jgi:hypothetical protein
MKMTKLNLLLKHTNVKIVSGIKHIVVNVEMKTIEKQNLIVIAIIQR